MASSLLTLGLAAVAMAAPHVARQTIIPHYPPTNLSTGFVLVANVTDPSLDFSPSINGWLLQGYHTGAGFNVAVLHANDTDNPGRLFYENGTAQDVYYGHSTLLTDGGEPLFPYAFIVQSPTENNTLYPTEHDVYIDAGVGTPTKLASFPAVYPIVQNNLGYGTFVACNNTVEYYHENFITVEYAYATFTDSSGNYDYNANIPDGCAPIALVPQCATLNDVPPGSYSSHEYANTVNCYADVAAIDWSQYGP